MSDTVTTASAALPASRDEPALFRLPAELLLDILSQLSYEQLHRVERVCKKLQTLVKDKSLDSLLFRQGVPQTPLPVGDTVELHPIIQLVEGIFWEPGKAVIKCWGGYDDEDLEINANEYKQTIKEFATSPACTTMDLVLHVFGNIDLVIEDDKGITVEYFFERLSEFWCGKPLPAGVVDDRPYWQRSDANDMLGDHRFWNGWDPAFVREDGEVQLDAMYYDS
ncbi:hypothetical protein JCM6882_005844 [Rhodosporidiobolus microsporus]